MKERFIENQVYASCNNPGGMLALPVGRLTFLEKGRRKDYAFCDVVYGEDLNKILDNHPEVTEICFSYRDTELILYHDN